MADQGPVVIGDESPLAVGSGISSNVATRQFDAAQLAVARDPVAGLDIHPRKIYASEIVLTTFLTVGAGVLITDDSITASMIGVTDLASINANLGTVTAGNIIVGTGGISISSEPGGGIPSTGVVIKESYIALRKGGVDTVLLDGATGDAYFKGTIQTGSTIDGTAASAVTQTFYQSSAPTASHIGDLWVDSDDLKVYRWNGSNWTTQTVANVNTTFAQASTPTALAAGDLWVDTDDGNKMYRATAPGTGSWVSVQDTAYTNKNKSFAQTSAPTALVAGDLWVDTDDGNKLYRATAPGTGNWVAVQDQAYTSKNVTFAQNGTPTALGAGDLWVDTDDGNKLYRATAAGTGSWVAVLDAIQPGGGVTVDASNHITIIDTTGVTIRSAATGARTQLDANGLTVYDSSEVARTRIDVNGMALKNGHGSTPYANERISFLDSGGTTEGRMWYDHTKHTMGISSLPGGSGGSSVLQISGDYAGGGIKTGLFHAEIGDSGARHEISMWDAGMRVYAGSSGGYIQIQTSNGTSGDINISAAKDLYLTGDNIYITGALSFDTVSHVRAYRGTSDQSIANATWTTIIYNTETVDTLTEYNTSTGEFTAANTGWYFVKASWLTSAISWTSAEAIIISLFVDGTEHERGQLVRFWGSASTQQLHACSSWVVYLTASQVLTIRAWQNSGASEYIAYNADYTQLRIRRLVG